MLTYLFVQAPEITILGLDKEADRFELQVRRVNESLLRSVEKSAWNQGRKYTSESLGTALEASEQDVLTTGGDVAVTDESVAVEVNVLANDSDPDNDPLVVSDYQITSVYSGTVNCTTAGVCIYTPPAAFTGTDTFTYTAGDGKGGTSSATVAVTVSPAPTPEPGQTGEQPQMPSAKRGKMI